MFKKCDEALGIFRDLVQPSQAGYLKRYMYIRKRLSFFLENDLALIIGCSSLTDKRKEET